MEADGVYRGEEETGWVSVQVPGMAGPFGRTLSFGICTFTVVLHLDTLDRLSLLLTSVRLREPWIRTITDRDPIVYLCHRLMLSATPST